MGMEKVKRIFDIQNLYNTPEKENLNVLGYKEDGQWKTYTAKQYIDLTNKVSSAFLNLGLDPGDRVATIMRNSPEWNFVDMGLMQIGGIQIPIYPTISLEHYKHIFNEAKVKAVIISDREMYEKLKPIFTELISFVITVDEIPGVMNWKEFLSIGEEVQIEWIKSLKMSVEPDDTATIIYTSGTTGAPKGVMLTHTNFVSNFQAVSRIVEKTRVTQVISFLPLCHVYERMLNYMYQNTFKLIYYAESIEKLSDNLKEVHPHMFCAVPRVLEKTYDKILNKGRNLPLLTKIVFFWALKLAERFDHHEKFGHWYHFQLKIADILVFKKWRKGLGGHLQIIVSGGATLQSKLARTFWAAGINIMEGYGLTETAPVIAVSNFEVNGIKIGTVGPILEGVEVKFADDGEILCKGPNIMKGYYLHPDKTKESFDADGWFKTGDVGYLEDDRFLKITDRKKEMFKTSGGKYIAPQEIESRLKDSPFIDNALIIGDNKKFTSALVLPNFYHLKSWCRVKGITYLSDSEMIKNDRIVKRFERVIDEMNENFGKVEKVKKFKLISEPWTVETGELSPTLKLKRRVLYQKYEAMIDSFYQD